MFASSMRPRYDGGYLSARTATVRSDRSAAAVLGTHGQSDQEQSRHNVSKSRSLKARIRGPARGAQRERRALLRQRTLRLESLETRALLTGYTYPYGAMPDDTGEYMLGEVAVNVVLMESDPTLAPYDNNPTNDPLHPGHGLAAEDWTASTISAIKDNVNTGLQWWKDTLVNMFPNAPANLLNFHINWKYADNPVH